MERWGWLATSVWFRGRGPLLRLCTAGAIVVLLASVAGFLLRDRVPTLAVLTYLPLTFFSVACLGYDLVRRGESLRPVRFGLAGVALPLAIWSWSDMIGWRTPPAAETPGATVRLMHWNVRWGGGLTSPERYWRGIRNDILIERPDILVLSEAPRPERLDSLQARLGPGWHSTMLEDPGDQAYWYRLYVASRYPIEREWVRPLHEGVAMALEIDAPGRPMRMLVVDGLSAPWRDRPRMLREVAGLMRDAERDGEAFDVVVGDFNAPSRSVGFDAFDGMGYFLASRYSGSWRANFHALMPVYDLDHIWLHPAAPPRDVRFVFNRRADHRGQVVDVLWPGKAARAARNVMKGG